MAVKKEFEEVEFHADVSFFSGLLIRIGSLIVKALTVVGAFSLTGNASITGNLTVSGLIDGVLKYKGIMTQATTGDPTFAGVDNSIGTIVWSRAGAGLYNGILVGAFPAGRTLLAINTNQADPFNIFFLRVDADTLQIQTYDDTWVADDIDGTITINVEVYPAV